MSKLTEHLNMENLSTTKSPMRYILEVKGFQKNPWHKFLCLSKVRKESPLDPKSDKFPIRKPYFVEIPSIIARYILGPIFWGRVIEKSKDIHFPAVSDS